MPAQHSNTTIPPALGLPKPHTFPNATHCREPTPSPGWQRHLSTYLTNSAAPPQAYKFTLSLKPALLFPGHTWTCTRIITIQTSQSLYYHLLHAHYYYFLFSILGKSSPSPAYILGFSSLIITSLLLINPHFLKLCCLFWMEFPLPEMPFRSLPKFYSPVKAQLHNQPLLKAFSEATPPPPPTKSTLIALFGFHDDTTELGHTSLCKTLPPRRLSSDSRDCATQLCKTSA